VAGTTPCEIERYETNIYEAWKYKEESKIFMRWVDGTEQNVQIVGIKG
jgi:hypothetical protein